MAVWLLLYRAASGPGLYKTDINSLTDVLRRGGAQGLACCPKDQNIVKGTTVERVEFLA